MSAAHSRQGNAATRPSRQTASATSSLASRRRMHTGGSFFNNVANLKLTSGMASTRRWSRTVSSRGDSNRGA
eukprot:7214542-Prymnesium_polylepis.1